MDGYALNQWNELNVFASDNDNASLSAGSSAGPSAGPSAGLVPIDNNISEREMKRIVLNRKNSLFVGNIKGSETAAILSSFTSTAKRHDIDPQLYFTQILANFPQTPISQLDSWLPDHWKQRQSTTTE